MTSQQHSLSNPTPLDIMFRQQQQQQLQLHMKQRQAALQQQQQLIKQHSQQQQQQQQQQIGTQGLLPFLSYYLAEFEAHRLQQWRNRAAQGLL